ncbi:alpha-1A adrenergic receptor-like, partial [Patella vulgata]|uniref:alpha-1A adrenergic receptor-like n=1 Tax=Patella vulgata TaxID=6465 RepID=UPI0024A8E6F4
MENTTLISANSSFITNMSSNEHPGNTSISWQKILLGTILYIVVFITIAGNALVLIAVYKVKKLQTVFNFYIVNLAVTDIGVASTAMSFYTIDNILGYWPFGEFMCGLWIFCDYGMTFASVFTLLVISVDRFWSVSWSVHYRANHNKRKSIIAIIAVWAVMVALWLPACIVDRIKNAADKVCIWEPSLNPEYVFVIALIGHHGACFVLLFCYLQVFFFMRKRA